ncbi:hypothetical protein B0H34DRAFT_825956 [Crassisporium funariophilum]|nr:hypothetical protein B0H34DRAFT_825956 [Crassisporium funariophilum]
MKVMEGAQPANPDKPQGVKLEESRGGLSSLCHLRCRIPNIAVTLSLSTGHLTPLDGFDLLPQIPFGGRSIEASGGGYSPSTSNKTIGSKVMESHLAVVIRRSFRGLPHRPIKTSGYPRLVFNQVMVGGDWYVLEDELAYLRTVWKWLFGHCFSPEQKFMKSEGLCLGSLRHDLSAP